MIITRFKRRASCTVMAVADPSLEGRSFSLDLPRAGGDGLSSALGDGPGHWQSAGNDSPVFPKGEAN